MNEKQMDALIGTIQIPALEVTRLGGFAPVEAEGTLCGKPFYFRARGNRWTFALASGPQSDPVDVLCQNGAGGFLRQGTVGEPDTHAAGYMAPTEAMLLIQQCAREYLQCQT